VVDGLTLDIRPGEFFSLLGPSGCGKTTLLRMLAGFELPDSGSIEVGEREITRVPVHQRDIGMVFQSYALFPHRTVAQNVGFPQPEGPSREKNSPGRMSSVRPSTTIGPVPNCLARARIRTPAACD
jgi:ABC-type Fe3+/spermidine/putrescine transport system ATPase subunit